VAILMGQLGVAYMALAAVVFVLLVPSSATRALQRWELNKFNCVFLGINHVLATYAVFCLCAGRELITDSPIQWRTCVFAALLYPASAMGITAGVHRLWAHRSYQAAAPLRCLLMLMNTLALQGSIFHWARDHRTHHKHTDCAEDPHDATEGLFYSHIGCFLLKKPEAVKEAGRKVSVADLEADIFVMWQKRSYAWFGPLVCFGMPGAVSTLWGDRFWTGFLIAGVLRYVWVLHVTWSINSLTHAFGPRPYSQKEMATENRITALLALGEGWHNWHHTFAHDYATSELGATQQFNPTKTFIDFWALLGMVWGRKRATSLWQARKDMWKRDGKVVVETLTGPPLFRTRTVEVKEAKDTKQD